MPLLLPYRCPAVTAVHVPSLSLLLLLFRFLSLVLLLRLLLRLLLLCRMCRVGCCRQCRCLCRYRFLVCVCCCCVASIIASHACQLRCTQEAVADEAKSFSVLEVLRDAAAARGVELSVAVSMPMLPEGAMMPPQQEDIHED